MRALARMFGQHTKRFRQAGAQWRLLAALALALCLLALLLLQPVATHAPVLATVILLPVALFGLVAVPRALWPAAELNPLHPLPAQARAHLLQRPPPISRR
jgi:hypothetical protein